VPSAVVPAESNVLVNPRHRAFQEVEPYGPVDPEIDERQQ
jgi:RES domain-containing protein